METDIYILQFLLDSNSKITAWHTDDYRDEKGREMWRFWAGTWAEK